MRAKQPEVYLEVNAHAVQIAALDQVEGTSCWIAWGFEDGAVERQFIVAEQDGAHRWHLPDQPHTPPPPVVMEAIKDYLLRIMCKAVGED